MKIPFDIKYKQDIIDGKVKVVTRDGKDVKIVCFDALNSTPIIASVQFENGGSKYSKWEDYSKFGHWMGNVTPQELDLFLIIPDPELTEFEKAVAATMTLGYKDDETPFETTQIIQQAQLLLNLAKEELKKDDELVSDHVKISDDEEMRQWIINYLDNKALNSCLVVERENLKKAISWLNGQKALEKQGQASHQQKVEEAMQEVDKKAKIFTEAHQGKTSEEIMAEMRGEQMSAEPKFKDGDWVMLDRPVLITKVEDMPYNTHQYWTSDGTWFGDATKAKLWTIEDAKDGNVLVTDSGRPFIFKGCLDESHLNNPVAYCGIDSTDCFCVARDINNWWTDENVYPATKEQRKQLEKAMADAEYTFDFEKKELKKIKPTPAWSEEDEDYFDAIIAKLEVTQEDAALTDNQMNFLKSLKGKIHPKQEWCEEDEKILKSIINDLSQNVAPEKEDIDWLKSLKDRVQLQPKQEWSEEDEKIGKELIDFCIKCSQGSTVVNSQNDFTRWTTWLKSLNPQTHWEPSNEQMEAFEHFVRSWGESGISSPYDNYTKLIYSLLQDLKKLIKS